MQFEPAALPSWLRRRRATAPLTKLAPLLLFLTFLTACATGPAGATRDQPVPGVILPLATDGAEIVDQRGRRVRFQGVSWYGAESPDFVVGGLDRQPLSIIAAKVREGGFTMVRLPWSNEMVARNPLIADERLAANPDLRGLRALDVFDRVVEALGAEGVMVVLDNHRSSAEWCCDESLGDGLWHTPAYPEAVWLQHWRRMAVRYRHLPHVVGAELRNAIRPDPSQGLRPTWGDGSSLTDWRAAAERGGEAVLQANPNLLIVVGGVDHQHNLHGVWEHPVRLSRPDRLVYAVHDYVWWRDAEERNHPRAFAEASHRRWGFVRERDFAHRAPVWISEWGGCLSAGDVGQCPEADTAYIAAMSRHLRDSRIDWAWQPLNGTQSSGRGRAVGMPETWGLLDPSWSRWSDPALVQRLTGPGR